ncbi:MULTISPECIES: tRNA lysidine(34) synthetase TilS [Rhodomicrobium]|uniref:tRNA lysidine(34) synthetase TilS n=1 Tax=Rhodomicrobium TaxID=1068 RepID=UPI000B4A639E|nr:MULTISPECIES: tRNA lysidine(34) synthetase TilS [Rhodomicrobium]
MTAADDDPGAERPPPFGHDELQALFGGFRFYPHLALAVSGGADSIALMHLTRAWLDLPRETSPTITVLTVDHRLRAASAAEADWVAQQAASAGFTHATLGWDGDKPKTGLQAAARAARYALLTNYCREHGIEAFATAHTADDQAETLLMRLARGSGVDGLAGMAAASRRGGLALLRPLLGISRARLEAFLRERRLPWIEDPSNADDRFERVRVRRLLKAGDMLGLSRGKLALSARRLGRARDALETATADFLAANLTLHDAGFGEIPLAALQATPEEIALRSIARMMHAFGGAARAPQLAKIEACWRELQAAGTPMATLGGCHLRPRGRNLMVAREFGRMEPQNIAATPGRPVLWDGRFEVIAPASDAALTIRPIGRAGIGSVKTAGGSFPAIPAIAAETLPSLWTGEALRFAPFAQFQPRQPANWLPDASARFQNAPILFARPFRHTTC